MFLVKGKLIEFTQTIKICEQSNLLSSYNFDLLEDSVAALNVMTGGINPVVTNVIYTNGEMDIWFPMGMQNVEGNPGAEVINIPCKYI